ncbi:preprotein translocase subunit SecE [bacterium]|nr:MAG: preprotein translocase subunit SecE [bacterium]
MANATATAPGGDEPKKSGALPVPKSRRGTKGFFNEVLREMKKVSWPSKAETHRLVYVVLAVCGILVAVLTIMSYVFGVVINLITKGSI